MQEWFPEAKLGIFLHWGMYSVDGVTESWSFFNGTVPYDKYLKQLDGFTADKYDADEWAKLFKDAGATYAVLTTKHHDGLALWDTKANDFSVVHKTPAGRDLITPYVEALRRHGLKVGLYYSHLDWSHPDYASLAHPQNDPKANPFAYSMDGDHPDRWQNFLKFHRTQIRELCEQFNPDLLWFDGDWERSAEQWDMKGLRDEIHAMCPNVVINSRMVGYGDYATPEQALPILRPEGPWEFCVTVNDNWGYVNGDHNHKSPKQIIYMFLECIANGGNLLLDIGPYADGSQQPEQVERLHALGEWIDRNREAVFGTIEGIPAGHHYGPTMLSKDQTVLYAVCYDPPVGGLAIKGIRNKILRVSVLGTEGELKHIRFTGTDWNEVPGILWIEPDSAKADALATVFKIELDGPLQLSRGKGRS